MYGQRKREVGKMLADSFQMLFCDTDELCEYQSDNIKRLLEEFGEAGYRKYEKKVVKQTSDYENTVIAVSGGTLANQGNFEIIKNNCLCIYLVDNPKNLYKNFDRKFKKLLRANSQKAFLELFDSLKPCFDRAKDIEVSTEGLEDVEILEKIQRKLREL